MSESSEELAKSLDVVLDLATHPYVLIGLLGVSALSQAPSLASVWWYGGNINKILGTSALGLGLLTAYINFSRLKTIKNERLLDSLLPKRRRKRAKRKG